MEPVFEHRRQIHDYRLRFVWDGGRNAEVSFAVGYPAKPFEPINAWDYETNTPRVERSDAGLAELVDEWVAVRFAPD